MANPILIATSAGLYLAAKSDGDWKAAARYLEKVHVTSVVVSGGVIFAASSAGVWCSSDGGNAWQRADKNLSIRHVRWLVSARDRSQTVLAGTQPAGIFRFDSAAAAWQGAPEVETLRDQMGWFLPYADNAGCVRGFALADSTAGSKRIYAAVEVGGVLQSADGGRTWRLVAGSDGSPDVDGGPEGRVHPDVHAITVGAADPDRVIAATGGGIYRSDDGGSTWKNIYPCYVRAVWVDPADPRHLIAGPADGVARNGRIEESFDGGNAWQAAAKGLQPPWPRHMVERFVRVGNNLLAVLSNGELLSASIRMLHWRRILPDMTGVTAVTEFSLPAP